jgi:hypothetical protein
LNVYLGYYLSIISTIAFVLSGLEWDQLGDGC